jgi:hypothetical protein
MLCVVKSATLNSEDNPGIAVTATWRPVTAGDDVIVNTCAALVAWTASGQYMNALSEGIGGVQVGAEIGGAITRVLPVPATFRVSLSPAESDSVSSASRKPAVVG